MVDRRTKVFRIIGKHPKERDETREREREGGREREREMVWQCSQSFDEGTSTSLSGDVVSALQFNKTGDLLATADCGGRVVIFEKDESQSEHSKEKEEPSTTNGRSGGGGAGGAGVGDPNGVEEERERYLKKKHQVVRYKPLTEFQSHEREFDYLKSMEIEERVNQVKWFHSPSSSINLLSTNDKRIKLWSIRNRKVKNISNFNFRPNMKVRPLTTSESNSANLDHKHKAVGGRLSVSTIVNSQIMSGGNLKRPYNSLRVPCISNVHYVMNATCRRNYVNGHLYHIHSIDINTDGETFISADDLHINLWNFEVMKESFNIVDMQPGNMDELTEVITCALFHPSHCNIMAYSSSKGTIRLTDLRSSALCDKFSKIFEVQRPQENHSFFTEIVTNVTDVKFTPSGNGLIARDYLSVKEWDIRNESEPVSVYNVQDVLSPKLVDLYENDCIFDKFECCMSHNGEYIASGSYSNTLRVFGVHDGTDELLEASLNPTNVNRATEPAKIRSPRFASLFGKGNPETQKRKELDLNQLDCHAKVRHMQWHPNMPLLALSSGNKVYMLSEVPGFSAFS